jgi:hypothetical protein
MKKIIFILIVLSFLFGKQVYGQKPSCICCKNIQGLYYWRPRCEFNEWQVINSACHEKGVQNPDTTDCDVPPPPSPQQPTLRVPEEKIRPGEVKVTWTSTLISVCPPGILGKGPCQYPSLIDLFQRINELLLKISPPLLVLLIILGGLMYLLTPFNVEEYIKKGHSYIKYAIFGYILLLLVTLIFTIISAFLGGPSP